MFLKRSSVDSYNNNIPKIYYNLEKIIDNSIDKSIRYPVSAVHTPTTLSLRDVTQPVDTNVYSYVPSRVVRRVGEVQRAV